MMECRISNLLVRRFSVSQLVLRSSVRNSVAYFGVYSGNMEVRLHHLTIRREAGLGLGLSEDMDVK